MARYLFFADESGNVTQEPGISDETGPSRYLSMGGCLISANDRDTVAAKLEFIQGKFKKTKNLHATSISHVQKIFLIRELLNLGFPMFGVVSDKTTLKGFKEKSGGEPQDYYNRTALYLLSQLGRYMDEEKIPANEVEIVFERRTHDYGRLRNYIGKVRRNPSGDGVDGIPFIDPASIAASSKDEEPLLSIPDVIAHSIFSAFDRNRNNFGITEIRYLDELMSGFGVGTTPSRFHLIKAERMQDICQPTVEMLKGYGLEIG